MSIDTQKRTIAKTMTWRITASLTTFLIAWILTGDLLIGASKNKPVGLVYIGIKKGNKILIKENRFKSKNRFSIQKTTVNATIKIINKII